MSLRHLYLRRWRRYTLGTLLVAAYQYAQYVFDTQLAEVTNMALDGRGAAALRMGLMLVCVAAAAFVLRVFSRIAIFNSGRIAEYELRRNVLERLHVLGSSFYRRINAGEIMSRATSDVGQVRLLLGFGVLNSINTLFGLVSAVAVMLSISPKLTLASFVTLPPLLLFMRSVGRQMFVRTRESQTALGKLSSFVQSSLSGIRLVRTYAIEDQQVEDFDKVNRSYLAASLALARTRGSVGPIIQSLAAVGTVVVLWYGGTLVVRGEVSEGGLLAFFRAILRLSWPLMSLGFIVSIVGRGRAAYQRIQELLVAEPDVKGGSALLPFKASEVPLEIRDLRFSYDAHTVLHDLNLQLQPGESVAIVGKTGAGKTTLASLLLRLLPTPANSIFVGGIDITDLPLEVLRGYIGVAQQSAFLFSTTVRHNIGFAMDHPDDPAADERIRSAAASAGVLSDIEGFPEGMETVVGERGIQLSGGQRQRVALARALLYSPRILVLDDPLSAVDAQTEQHILAALREQMAARSVVLITHRVSAARTCDRILVMEEGRILEEGQHADLMQRGGAYTRLYRAQQLEQELSALSKAPGPPAASSKATA